MNRPHFYSWLHCWSTDPDWSYRKLTKVECDGEIIKHVSECFTGPDGFVRYAEENEKGELFVEDGLLIKKVRRGLVEVEMSKG